MDPNLAYLLLVGGFVFAILALFAPGTGLLEAIALTALVVAGYGISSLPVNFWAVPILVVGVIPFAFAVIRWRQWGYLVVSLVSLVGGSIFLFRGPDGTLAVNPYIVALVSTLAVLLLWYVSRKGLEAMNRHKLNNPEMVDGMTGVARTAVNLSGTVYVNSEEWSARSAKPIAAGSKVRVVKRDGFVLEVVPQSAPVKKASN